MSTAKKTMLIIGGIMVVAFFAVLRIMQKLKRAWDSLEWRFLLKGLPKIEETPQGKVFVFDIFVDAINGEIESFKASMLYIRMIYKGNEFAIVPISNPEIKDFKFQKLVKVAIPIEKSETAVRAFSDFDNIQYKTTIKKGIFTVTV